MLPSFFIAILFLPLYNNFKGGDKMKKFKTILLTLVLLLLPMAAYSQNYTNIQPNQQCTVNFTGTIPDLTLIDQYGAKANATFVKDNNNITIIPTVPYRLNCTYTLLDQQNSLFQFTTINTNIIPQQMADDIENYYSCCTLINNNTVSVKTTNVNIQNNIVYIDLYIDTKNFVTLLLNLQDESTRLAVNDWMKYVYNQVKTLYSDKQIICTLNYEDKAIGLSKKNIFVSADTGGTYCFSWRND